MKATTKRQAAPARTETTTSSGKAISAAEGVKARAAYVATNRWATIQKIDDKDPREEVIVISLMEAGPPEPSSVITDENNEHAGNYTYQPVAPGVVIGMRKGGAFESVDGFGWRDAEDKIAHGSPVGSGATRLADVGVS